MVFEMVFKIKQINPVSTKVWEEPNLRVLEKFKNPDTEIHIATLKKGPKEMGDKYREAQVVGDVLKETEAAEKEGFDAITMSCFGDIGLDAMKEAADIPVVGACQAALHLASLVGTKISVISTGRGRSNRDLEDLVLKYGFKSKLASIRRVKLTPVQFAEEKEELKKQIIVEAKKAINEDGADVIVLGCGGMNLHLWLQEQLGVPVIDPLIAATKIAEVLGKMKLTQSKIAYPKP